MIFLDISAALSVSHVQNSWNFLVPLEKWYFSSQLLRVALAVFSLGSQQEINEAGDWHWDFDSDGIPVTEWATAVALCAFRWEKKDIKQADYQNSSNTVMALSKTRLYMF